MRNLLARIVGEFGGGGGGVELFMKIKSGSRSFEEIYFAAFDGDEKVAVINRIDWNVDYRNPK